MPLLQQTAVKTTLKIVCAAALFIGLERFCNWQTGGFRLYDVQSDLGNAESWETPSLDTHAQHLLKQPFFYLGSGGQFYAFLSKDKRVVLKLFKHTTPTLIGYKKRSSIESILDSCKIAYYNLRKETGLITVHLNKGRGEYGMVSLHDKIGALHRLNLDQTEFALQYYATPIFSYIAQHVKSQDETAARRSVTALFKLVSTCSSKGIRNTDPSIHRNCGFIGDSLIFFDIGSFHFDPTLKKEEAAAKQLIFMTKNLGRWVRKHEPSLLPHFHHLSSEEHTDYCR